MSVELIENNPIFRGIPAKVLARLVKMAKPREYQPGELVVEQGKAGTEFFVILSGLVEVIQSGDTLVTLGPGQGVGEIALVERVPRTATIRALEKLTVLCFERKVFDLIFLPGSTERKKLTENIQGLTLS